MFRLRKAKSSESREILAIYKSIISSSETGEFNPKWNENYPDLKYIEDSISHEELYVFTANEKIIASVVVNNMFDDAYNDAEWIIDAEPCEITIIHAFAVNPKCRSKGYARKIFELIKQNALKNNQKSIRLDVIDGNDGARKVFEKLGFEYIDTISMFHIAVGLEKFHLYEFVLK